MSIPSAITWVEANQRYLMAALAPVRHALECYIKRLDGDVETASPQGDFQQALDATLAAMPASPALTRLCTVFGLSPFERDIVLLCAGVDLDGSFAALYNAAHNSRGREHSTVAERAAISYPTFSLALAALPQPHWDAITPGAPLRHWQLIMVGSGTTLTLNSLRIDERILHFLAGVSLTDERLAGMITPLPTSVPLVPSHHLLMEQLVNAWSQPIACIKHLPLAQWSGSCRIPIIQLCGEDSVSKPDIAGMTCAALKLNLNLMPADALLMTASEIRQLARLWEREAALNNSALLLDCDRLDTSDTARMNILAHFIEQMSAPLIMATREHLHLSQHRTCPVIMFDVVRPAPGEQHALWQNALGAINLNGHVDTLIAQFNLSASAIHTISTGVLDENTGGHGRTDDNNNLEIAHNELSTLLWDACRMQARPRLDGLAHRIEPGADWYDLVLPEMQMQLLREVIVHVRQRSTVYEKWGFRSGSARGLGISALFAGVSGTGKTLAAEVLAHELRLDLYRIDLSSVVSKYIGETEKNLRLVFDAAEEGGAILLFDEADALFGKRSEVKDSHDRYANIEVSYLLQRMEAYQGLAILTTNLKSALDTAFLRRIRFVVHFPFPDAAQRKEIWQHTLPRCLPTEHLDISKLARLNVAGGNIRNIALNAAFLAADAREPVRMTHMLRAAYTEYTKLEKPLTEAEIGGWL